MGWKEVHGEGVYVGRGQEKIQGQGHISDNFDHICHTMHTLDIRLILILCEGWERQGAG